MKIILLAKRDEYADKAHALLIRGGKNLVHETDEKLSAEQLSYYDLGISWFYKHILKEDQLSAVPLGILNNHCGYLPYGRGAMPNVWALLGEPAGVTLHYMSVGVDEGDIVAQKHVVIQPDDTAETLYVRLVEEQYKLFMDSWTSIETMGVAGLRALSTPQPQTQPNGLPWPTHRVRDVLLEDDLDGYDDGRFIVDHLRARTFPPHESMYFHAEGKKYYVRVRIEKAQE